VVNTQRTREFILVWALSPTSRRAFRVRMVKSVYDWGRRANGSIDLGFDGSISSPSTDPLPILISPEGKESTRIRFRSFRECQGSTRVFVVLIFVPLGASSLHVWLTM
jgi:hypothetical protein